MPAPSTPPAPGADGSPAVPFDSFDAAFNAAAEAQGGTSDGDASAGDGDSGDGDGGATPPPQPTEQTEEEDQSDEASDDEGTEDDGDADDAADASSDGDGDDASDDTDTEDGGVKVGELLAELKKSNPELYKRQQRYFTQRQQQHAAEIKLARAIQANPVAAAKHLLKQNGITIPEADNTPPETKAALNPDLVEIEMAKVPGVTPEQAKGLAGIFTALVKSATDPIIKKDADREAEALRTRATVLANAANDDFNSFKKDYPDVVYIEKDMEKMMDRITPGKGVNNRQWLEMCRALVLQDKSVAERVRKTIAKMTEAAKNAKSKSASVPASVVQPGSKRIIDFDEAAEMAQRGETVGKGVSY